MRGGWVVEERMIIGTDESVARYSCGSHTSPLSVPLRDSKTERKLFFSGAFRMMQNCICMSVCTCLVEHRYEPVPCMTMRVHLRAKKTKKQSTIFIDQNNGGFWRSDRRPWQATVNMWPVPDKTAPVKTSVLFFMLQKQESNKNQWCKMMFRLLFLNHKSACQNEPIYMRDIRVFKNKVRIRRKKKVYLFFSVEKNLWKLVPGVSLFCSGALIKRWTRLSNQINHKLVN